MIGHYLLTLTPEQEDRVLTTGIAGCNPGYYEGEQGCLMQVTTGAVGGWMSRDGDTRCPVWVQYDSLRERFGTERVVVAIRNRILSNQARRALQCPQLEAV